MSEAKRRDDHWFDHLVYLRVFEGCDLHCQHCFIPANPKRMSLEQVAQVPQTLRDNGVPVGSRIVLQLHGGEPSLMGADWIRQAVDTLRREGSDMEWRFGIQTNLMGYDADWGALYREHFFDGLGVSWDYKIRLTHKNRPESNERFETKFWTNFDQARRDALIPRLVITVTKKLTNAYRSPIELLHWLVDRGVEDVHFERITLTGNARDNWDEIGLNNREYSRWMARLFRAYALIKKENPTLPLSVSPCDGIFESIERLQAGEAGGHGCWSGTCDTRFHTIDANGYKSGCTALTSEFDNKRMADVEQVIHIDDIIGLRKKRTSNHGCHTCDFKPICSSGCLATSIHDGSGECSGGWAMFDAARQTLTQTEKVNASTTPP